MEVNKIICCNCITGMRALPSNSVHLTVTSPPYDKLRRYGGHRWTWALFEELVEQLYRVTAPGGVVVWVVKDQVLKGSLSFSGFAQGLAFGEAGFRFHDEIGSYRLGNRTAGGRVRYGPPERILVFSKGKPRCVNLLRDKPNKHAGKPVRFSVRRGDRSEYDGTSTVAEYGFRPACWLVEAGATKTTTDRFAYQHPALMPEGLAADLIQTYSRPGDLVFDPMCGAGTTLKMAKQLGRNYLGMEIESTYVTLAEQRVQKL